MGCYNNYNRGRCCGYNNYNYIHEHDLVRLNGPNTFYEHDLVAFGDPYESNCYDCHCNGNGDDNLVFLNLDSDYIADDIIRRRRRNCMRRDICNCGCCNGF